MHINLIVLCGDSVIRERDGVGVFQARCLSVFVVLVIIRGVGWNIWCAVFVGFCDLDDTRGVGELPCALGWVF